MGGEAKHFAGHGAATFFLATIGALVNTPEVVGVVEQVGDGVLLSEVAAPFGHDGERVVRLIIRPVGAAEHEAVLGAVGTELPLQGHAGRLDTVGVVGRINGHSLFGTRQFVNVDFHLEVVICGGSDQVVGTRQHVQTVDFRTDTSNRLIWFWFRINRSFNKLIDAYKVRILLHITKETGLSCKVGNKSTTSTTRAIRKIVSEAKQR